MTNDTKQCKTCKQEKPLSEFYTAKHRPNYHYPRCKQCTQATNKSASKCNSPEHERYVVAQIKANGLRANHGKHFINFAHVDIIVEGHIRVEAKLMKRDKRGGWYSGITEDQRANGFKADVVCLIMEDNLYFFDPNHPAFYIKGALRSKILYNPNSKRQHLTNNRKLTVDDMKQAYNRYSLITDKSRR